MVDSERSQHSNKATAVEILKAKVFTYFDKLDEENRAAARAKGSEAVIQKRDRWFRTYDDRYNRNELTAILEGGIEPILFQQQLKMLNERLPEMIDGLREPGR